MLPGNPGRKSNKRKKQNQAPGTLAAAGSAAQNSEVAAAEEQAKAADVRSLLAVVGNEACGPDKELRGKGQPEGYGSGGEIKPCHDSEPQAKAGDEWQVAGGPVDCGDLGIKIVPGGIGTTRYFFETSAQTGSWSWLATASSQPPLFDKVSFSRHPFLFLQGVLRPRPPPSLNL